MIMITKKCEKLNPSRFISRILYISIITLMTIEEDGGLLLENTPILQELVQLSDISSECKSEENEIMEIAETKQKVQDNCQLALDYWNDSTWEKLDELLMFINDSIKFETITKEAELSELAKKDWDEIESEERNHKKASFQQSKKELGRKIFVGNINFQVTNDPEAQLDVVRILLPIFLKFGNIELVRVNIEKRFCFIVFNRISVCKETFWGLRKSANRLGAVAQLKKTISQSTQKDKYLPLLPQTIFYCRWPKDTNQKFLKKPKKKTKKVSSKLL